jgi:hypothetical protein
MPFLKRNPSFVMTSPLLLACSRVAIVSVSIALSGCLVTRRPPPPPATCAVLLLHEGDELPPTPADFIKLQPKLSAYLADRGMLLVRDLNTAERVARVSYRPHPENPGMGDLFVYDITFNTLLAAPALGGASSGNEQEIRREAAAVLPLKIANPNL